MLYSSSIGGFYTKEIHGDNIPADAVDITDEEYQRLLEGQARELRIVPDASGKPTLSPTLIPTAQDLVHTYESALDAHLDSVARSHRYDNRFTFALRAGFNGPYRVEGEAFAEWMDNCNYQSYKLMQDVLSGKVQLPSIEDFIASLPEFVKP